MSVSKEELDYKKMLKEINDLVETDFGEDMSLRANIEYCGKLLDISQRDAREMANIIAKVYLISHCIHCKSCGAKYLKET